MARYRAVLASTLDPIVTIDASGVIQSVSNSIERVFGWKPDELLGRNVSLLMPEPHHSAHDGYLANYRRTGVTNILGRTREFEAVRKDGTLFPMELSVARVDIPGKPPLFTGIIHDITDRKVIERALATRRDALEQLVDERTRSLEETHEKLRTADRLASIGTLAAGLGHDMNNVLLPVRCRLDVLEAGEVAPEIREQLTAIRRSVDYLQNLADGLHLLALDPGEEEASEGSTDLNLWWEQVGTLLARSVPRHVRLTTSWATDLPALAVPPHRLTQAVLNLFVNAGEAVGEDGRIRVEAELDSGQQLVHVSVADNGFGMTEEVRRRALDPFFTTKKRGLGTGLGLSLVHGVVRSVGGAIHIDSQPSRGTTITLSIPLSRATGPASDEPQEMTRIAAVCVADSRLRGLVSALLASEGFEVREVPARQLAGARLAVTDASDESRAAVLASPPRGLVVLGEAGPAWRALAPIIVSRVDDFQAISAGIAAAIHKDQSL